MVLFFGFVFSVENFSADALANKVSTVYSKAPNACDTFNVFYEYTIK